MRTKTTPSWLPTSRTLLAIATLAFGWSSFAGGIVTSSSETELRNAVNSGGLVTIAFSGTTVLTSPLILSADTTIDASGYNFTLSGGGTTRILEVPVGRTLRLVSVSLTQGYHSTTSGGGHGLAGAVLVDGSLHAKSCSFVDNRAAGTAGAVGQQGGSARGGAISSLGSLYLTNCVFLANRATGGNGGDINPSTFQGGVGGDSDGAAIYAAGGVTVLSGVSFGQNSATAGNCNTTGGTSGAGRGGAVSIASGNLLVINSTFTNNSSTVPDSAGTLSGQTVEASGGAIFSTASSTMISNSYFTGNNVRGGRARRGSTAGAGKGGAVSLSGPGTVSDSRFSTNTVQGGGGGSSSGTGDGGALFANGEVAVLRCTFSDNESYAVQGNSVGATGWYPPAPPRGGAIHNAGSMSVDSSIFIGNRAFGVNGGEGSTRQSSPAYGGGLFNSGTATLTNCTFISNLSKAGSFIFSPPGPGAFPETSGSDGYGGGLFSGSGTVVLASCTFAVNDAAAGTGVVPGSPRGGAISLAGGSATIVNTILAGGTSGLNVYGTITDGGHNIVSDGSAGFTSGTSLVNTDPKLGTLSDNGGPTLTIPLLPDSPAINALSSGYPATDQRGFARPNGAGADIGAFEFDGVPAVITLASINGSISGWGLGDEFTMSLVGGSSTTTTNRVFGFSGLSAGSYTVVPTHPDYFFLPPSRFITVTTQPTNVAFQAFRFGKMSLDTSSTGAISVAFPSTAGGSFVLLRSSNLTSWLPIQTNFIVGPGGLSQWMIPTTNAGPAFFKVVKP